MPTELTAKIVGYRIKKENAVEEQPARGQTVTTTHVDESPFIMPVVDVNPLTVRIERRPEGAMEAVSEKISYSDYSGRQRVYVVVSFIPVEGVVNGEKVIIERPIEFFVPSDQLTNERQWITATMRSLSLAARGGYITQALQDLRKVVWDKGPVRCGKNKHGKPNQHDSIVAAIAWSIQQILHRRGFLDEDGNQIKVEKLVANQKSRLNGEEPAQVSDIEIEQWANEIISNGMEEPAETGKSTSKKSAGTCPECQSEMELMDGCPTCLTCGHSKCG